ncbi:MAG: hypothetical protein ACT4PP_14580 [Sporichthyaceae bacterium]
MSTPPRPLTAVQAELLTTLSEPWLSCDDCFEQMDGCVDALIHHGRLPEEPMRVHLACCPACQEEAQSLISLVATEHITALPSVLGLFRDKPSATTEW